MKLKNLGLLALLLILNLRFLGFVFMVPALESLGKGLLVSPLPGPFMDYPTREEIKNKSHIFLLYLEEANGKKVEFDILNHVYNANHSYEAQISIIMGIKQMAFGLETPLSLKRYVCRNLSKELDLSIHFFHVNQQREVCS